MGARVAEPKGSWALHPMVHNPKVNLSSRVGVTDMGGSIARCLCVGTNIKGNAGRVNLPGASPRGNEGQTGATQHSQGSGLGMRCLVTKSTPAEGWRGSVSG